MKQGMLRAAAVVFAAAWLHAPSVRAQAQASPPDATPSEAFVTRPVWTRRPAHADLARLHPRTASRTSAKVAVDCLIDESGRFTTCKVVREDPPGRGFGESTLRLAKFFQMRLRDADGIAVAGRHLVLPVWWGVGP